jgi:hypothetical protein
MPRRGAAGPIARGRCKLPLPPDLPPQGKKESSFSEEKEAKRLLFIDAGRSDFSASNS